MANPHVRPNLRFLPEDAGSRLSEAWQGARWLKELEPELTTPMVCAHNQDFYIFEPVMLEDQRVCMPIRWFTRGSNTIACVWAMESLDDGSGWVVQEHMEYEVDLSKFLLSFPHFVASHKHYRLSDPRIIIGIVCFLSL
jgi:hypothetical protein